MPASSRRRSCRWTGTCRGRASARWRTRTTAAAGASGRPSRPRRWSRRLAEGLAATGGIRVDPARIETNIVIFELDPALPLAAAELSRRLAERGVRIGPIGPRRLRAVTHLDVAADGIDRAIEAVRAA